MELTDRQLFLLRQIANDRDRSLSETAALVGFRPLSEEERHRLRMVLAAVFMEELNAEDDSPTQLGAEIEGVIDALLYS